jgi:hypothetical protein
MGDGAAIERAFDLIPAGLRRFVAHTHFLTRSDPVFVGLHDYIDAGGGLSYKDIAHLAYPHNQERTLPRSQRWPTCVLPTRHIQPWIIVHELGHALDHRLGFSFTPAVAVTRYAATNRQERFAEAFTAYVCRDEKRYAEGPRQLLQADTATVDYFDRLSQPASL